MKYTVEFNDRVSNSAFIYSINDNKLFGCDIVISTDKDEELYNENRKNKLRFEDLTFNVSRNQFESKKVPDLESKIATVEKRQRERNWNCIKIEDFTELDEAIQKHLINYMQSVKDRISIQQAKRVY